MGWNERGEQRRLTLGNERQGRVRGAVEAQENFIAPLDRRRHTQQTASADRPTESRRTTLFASRDRRPAPSDGDVTARRSGLFTAFVGGATVLIGASVALWEFLIKPGIAWTSTHIIAPAMYVLDPVIVFGKAYIDTVALALADPTGTAFTTWVVIGVCTLVIVSMVYGVNRFVIRPLRRVYRYFRPKRSRRGASESSPAPEPEPQVDDTPGWAQGWEAGIPND